MTNSLAPSTDRLHALDAVRGGALLLGVVLHAAMSFFPQFVFWMVDDPADSRALSYSFYTIHMFRLSLFFLLAGFFAHMALHRKGAAGFAGDRALRIVVPLIVAWPILHLAMSAATQYAVTVGVAPGFFQSAAIRLPDVGLQVFPLAHLWFLYVLILFYAAAMALFLGARLIDPRGHIGRVLDPVVRILVKTHLAPLVLGAPAFALLYFNAGWTSWAGIPTPDMTLLTNKYALVGYGVAFGFGWLLHRQVELLSVWRNWWPLHLAVAAACTAGCLYLVGGVTFTPPQPMGWERAATTAMYMIGLWTWSFGLIGLALRVFSRPSPARRYLADASYWIYLIHLPVVLLLQAVSAQIAAPWFVKFPALLFVAMALMLASYHLLVRYTVIGRVLNGRRYRAGERATPAGVPALAPAQ
jgi:peptidoglycan/LPS O-acetylase OafA/YrhL